jgi:hypothetical protein
MRIMLYSLDGDNSTVFNQPEDEEVAVPVPNEADCAPLTPATLLKWCYVENADFDRMAMTRSGTVICHRRRSMFVFVDQEALDTGLVLMCRIGNNGQVLCEGRVWPVLMRWSYERMTIMCWPMEEILNQDMFRRDKELRR